MPTSLPRRVFAQVRLRNPVRRALGDRPVTRSVQGVSLRMPWSHRLPDYAALIPEYSQNLVRLAAALSFDPAHTLPLQVIDIGANIGDSARQIAAQVDARVLCIEGDPYWVPYLTANSTDTTAITIERALLLVDSAEADEAAGTGAAAGARVPVRQGGTTRFEVDTAASENASEATVTPAELRARHPEFDAVRLLKCDTDGFDAVLVPPMAAAFAETHPVVFFEFDPVLAAKVGTEHPEKIWSDLAALGYSVVAAWDNVGTPLGHLPIAQAEAATRGIPAPTRRSHTYWDVAVAHADDEFGCEVLRRLNPATLGS